MGRGGVLLLDQGSLELSLVLILPPECQAHIQVCASTPKCLWAVRRHASANLGFLQESQE